MAGRHFKVCFVHCAQVLALRRDVKGCSATARANRWKRCWRRVTEPGSLPSLPTLHHRCAVERRRRLALACGPGVFLNAKVCSFLDSDQLSVTGDPLGRVWRASIAGRWGRLPIVRWRSPRRCGQASGPTCWGPRCIYPTSGSPTPARARARIPATVAFQETWRQALRLLRQVRASGFTVTGVLADAEFGDNRALSRHVASAAAAVCRRHFVVPHRLFGNARRAAGLAHLGAVVARARIRSSPSAFTRGRWGRRSGRRRGNGGGSGGAIGPRRVDGRRSVWRFV